MNEALLHNASRQLSEDESIRGHYWIVLAKESSAETDHVTVILGTRLIKIARSLHRMYENACNYDLSDSQYRRMGNLENEATQIATEMGCTVIHNSDPRGAPLRLIVPSGYSNSWGGGLVVPF